MRGWSRRSGGRGLVAGVLGVLMLVTACGSGGDAEDPKSPKVGTEKGPSEAVVAIAPEDGAENVATSGLTIRAERGKLTSVTVQDEEDQAVEGRIARDGARWQAAEHLANSTRYTVHAVARDAAGRETTERSTFTTLAAEETFTGRFTPEDGSTVGVGMPVSITFDRPVSNRDEVREAVRVTAEPAVPIKGHWFGDQRLDFRPEKYWKAGTEVTLSLRLRGVEGADGVYGTQRKDVRFTIGRSQVSTVDAEKKTMTVKRDGKTLKTIPITAGAPATPTWNGVMVISEKHEVTRMNGATVGFAGEYDIPDVPHAMRLSTSGTFIHGNYWTPKSTFGSGNVSHGCIGLFDHQGGGSDTPGAWFFDNSLVGDVVEVKNSRDATVAPDNGLNGWNMPWSEWGAEA